MIHKKAVQTSSQLDAWLLLLTEFQNPEFCPPWLTPTLPLTGGRKPRLIKKQLTKMLQGTGVTLQIAGIHPQLQANPVLRIWFGNDANIAVDIQYQHAGSVENVGYDSLYGSDLEIRHCQLGFYCARCTTARYWPDPLSLWRAHVLSDFVAWCEQQLFAHQRLELWFDHSPHADGADFSQVRLSNNAVANDKKLDFLLWQANPVHQAPLQLVNPASGQPPELPLAALARQVMATQMDVMQALADR